MIQRLLWVEGREKRRMEIGKGEQGGMKGGA